MNPTPYKGPFPCPGHRTMEQVMRDEAFIEFKHLPPALSKGRTFADFYANKKP